VLTKPLGTGALVAAMKKGRLSEDQYQALVTCMTTLNRCGEYLFDLGATACTDVTGFGLTGHGLEMARGSGLTLHIDPAALPQLPEAVQLCGEGFTCGGTKSNAAFVNQDVHFGKSVGQDMIGLLNDPQTSGGLLVSVPADKAEALQAAVLGQGALCAALIGKVTKRAPDGPYLVFGP
jgi:selenide,water dikinase